MDQKNFIISKLFSIGAIKTGKFTLKSGIESNIYCDLRLIISYPNIYNYLLSYAETKYPDLFHNIDVIYGVDFGGIPFANYISFHKNIPQIHIRSEIKKHGTQKKIEGHYNASDHLLMVEDVITTGGSLAERIHMVTNEIIPSKILVILDRRDSITPQSNTLFDYPLYSLFTFDDIENYIKLTNKPVFTNTISNNIYNAALKKESNIVLSCDYADCTQILSLIEAVGNYIVGVKLHINILVNYTPKFIDELFALKRKYNLFIIEDGKFADIGNIVIQQLNGYYKINKWADLITAHAITGEGIINSVKEIYPHLDVLLITELSSKNNLIDDTYTDKSLTMAIKNGITGVISQENIYNFREKQNIPLLTFSPGINLNNTNDGFDQTYKQAEQKLNNGMFWIIGRGIYDSKNVIESCVLYKELGWEHFKNY